MYSSFVRSCTLHSSETWPIKKENKIETQSANIMRMITGVCY